MKALLNTVILLTIVVWPLLARDTESHRLVPLSISQVVIEDGFWSPKIKVWRDVSIPDCLAKFEKDGALANFDKVRDGTGGEHGGPPWYDGLIYEMIRGCADFLAAKRDAALEARLDRCIERIAAAAARDPDGYVNTYTQLKEPTHRWGLNGGDDNWQHDVYNAGAMVEAAVHYYRATGKVRLLGVATRLANHMSEVMGPPPKKNVVPGHSLGEEALVKLFLLFQEKPDLKSSMPVTVDERRYLQLAEFWIEHRGKHEGRKSYGTYGQDHQPVLQQTTIEGHAVRATLLCAGLVAAGTVNGREDYLAAAVRLWENMVQRRMYVIGGLGAVAGHEGFGLDYELPNNGYLETCAAIGAGFFHHHMNLALGDARYADELERVLYNAVLPGVSLPGDTYFYENPLEAGPKRARWAWHGCPCCPPMFFKIMGALPGYIYAQDSDGLYVNLFVSSRAETRLSIGRIALRQTTQYPWDGAVKLSLELERETDFALNLRLPGWCHNPEVRINGTPEASLDSVGGYARLRRRWQRGDVVELALPMPVQRLKAHPKVKANVGRVALQRGPLVYCFEGADNGGHVRNLVISPEAPLRVQHRPELLGGVTVIQGPALALHRVPWPDRLYLASESVPGATQIEFTAIPYFLNANRQPGEMQVWMAETPSQAYPLPSPSVASRASASASHCWQNDALSALNDQIEPASSDDASIPRFTWWDHRGTQEWVQFEFDQPRKISAAEVYWWDERRINAHCRVPQSWRLLFKDGAGWKPVPDASSYGTATDLSNRVIFTPITTSALRMEVQLQPDWSAGILEWHVE
ncbi:MAG TPA: glycoside hydrolase family 127 protein [Candidatus Paceibacterota bacterium]|nr:glycoside hydrolase family 127 protein [Verrucomicrobiota bacterium]HSA02639.1 glycoside hydrolase family 127 protein [Candidatus Paceibacterota bacterium]